MHNMSALVRHIMGYTDDSSGLANVPVCHGTWAPLVSVCGAPRAVSN